jgi:hypothetical protein
VFGVHKHGYMIPVLLCVRESPPNDGPPTFIVLMRELRTDDNHFLMLGDFTIVGASSVSVTTLGVDPSSFETKEANMRDFVQEWDAQVTAMSTTSQSAIFCIKKLTVPSPDQPDPSDTQRGGDDASYISSDEEHAQDSDHCWVRGRLQRISLSDCTQIHVLHWQKVPESDQFTILKAQARLRATRSKANLIETQPPPVQVVVKPMVTASKSLRTSSSFMSRSNSFRLPNAGHTLSLRIGVPALIATPEEDTDALASLSQDGPTGLSSSKPLHSRSSSPDPIRKGGVSTRGIGGLQALVPSSMYSGTTKSALKSIKSTASFNDRDGSASEGKSQTSESSTASKSLSRLRKLFTDNAPPLLPGLKSLRLVGLAITVLAIGLASAIAVTSQTSFRAYLQNVEYTTLGAERILRTFNSMIAMQDLVAGAAGWDSLAGSNYGGNDTLAEMALRGYILGNISEFTKIHREMYSRILLTTASASYTVKRITVVRFDVPGAPAEGVTEVMNLFEAGMAFASKLAQIAVTPLHNLTQYANNDVRFANVNAIPGGNIHEQLHATMEAGYSLSLEAKDQVIQSQLTIFISMVGILAFFSVCVFLPILFFIERAKDAIVVRFVELPPLVRSILLAQAVKRYKALKQNYLDDDEEEEEDDEDDDLDELGLPQRADRDKVRDPDDETGQVSGDPDDVDWNKVMNTSANTSKSKRSKSRKSNAPSYRKSLRSFIFLVLEFIGPLLSLIGFFVIVFAMSLAYINKALVLSSIAASATARSSCSREVMMDLIRMVTVVADRPFMSIQDGMVLDTADCISYYLHLLAFGPESGDYRAAFAEHTPIVETGNSPYLSDTINAQVYSALFSDACPFLQSVTTDPNFDIERCRSFGGGVFAQGLQAGINEYTRRTQVLADRRMRVRTFDGEEEVYGILLSKVGYDYAADACNNCDGAVFEEDNSITPVPPLINDSYIGDVSPLILLNTSLLPDGAKEYHIRQDMQGSDMLWVRDADAMYVTPGLFGLANIYSQLTISVINEFLQFIVIFVILFLLVFVTYMLLGFLPQIRRTNHDIQTKRTMLLYLPPEIVNHNKAIKDLVHDILAAESEGISTKPMGGR